MLLVVLFDVVTNGSQFCFLCARHTHLTRFFFFSHFFFLNSLFSGRAVLSLHCYCVFLQPCSFAYFFFFLFIFLCGGVLHWSAQWSSCHYTVISGFSMRIICNFLSLISDFVRMLFCLALCLCVHVHVTVCAFVKKFLKLLWNVIVLFLLSSIGFLLLFFISS